MATGGKQKVAVIGAGMVGVCTAGWLQRDGHDVVIVDPKDPGEGTSFGNAGCLNGSSVVPMSLPGNLKKVPRWLMDPLGPLAIRWSYLPTLAPWLLRFVRSGQLDKVEATARALTPMTKPCLETLAPLVKAAGAEDLVQQRGHLVVYPSKAEFEKEALVWRLRRDNGFEWDEFDDDGLRQLDQSLSRDYKFGALIRGNGHTTNPHRLVNALADAFRRNGGEILKTRVTGFELDGARLRGLRTERGPVPADRAVLCAGAWSKPLAKAVGNDVPLETERGYHLIIKDPEVVPRIPTTDAAGKYVATPMETGLRFAGTVELAGLDAAPDWRRAHMLLKQGRRLFPALKESYPEDRLSVWMGHRPSLPDSMPVIGPSRNSPDVLYAFGHAHIGMISSPMTGKTIADLVAGRPPSMPIEPFRAERFD
jgi:D-amino-acid dehydrogenase